MGASVAVLFVAVPLASPYLGITDAEAAGRAIFWVSLGLGLIAMLIFRWWTR